MGKNIIVKAQCSKFKVQTSAFSLQPSTFICLLSAVCCLLFNGCGYTIQTRADLPFDTLSIGKIENKTIEPKLEDRLSKELAETFSEYGFRISSSARYKVEGEITKFELQPLVEQDLITTQYKVVIKANLRLIDTSSGKIFPIFEESPFITYFNSVGNLPNVIAQKELSLVSALKEICQAVVRRIIYNKQLLIGSLPSIK